MHGEKIAYPAEACPTHNGTKNGGPRSTLNIVVAPHTCMLFLLFFIWKPCTLVKKATSRSHVFGASGVFVCLVPQMFFCFVSGASNVFVSGASIFFPCLVPQMFFRVWCCSRIKV